MLWFVAPLMGFAIIMLIGSLAAEAWQTDKRVYKEALKLAGKQNGGGNRLRQSGGKISDDVLELISRQMNLLPLLEETDFFSEGAPDLWVDWVKYPDQSEGAIASYGGAISLQDSHKVISSIEGQHPSFDQFDPSRWFVTKRVRLDSLGRSVTVAYVTFQPSNDGMEYTAIYGSNDPRKIDTFKRMAQNGSIRPLQEKHDAPVIDHSIVIHVQHEVDKSSFMSRMQQHPQQENRMQQQSVGGYGNGMSDQFQQQPLPQFQQPQQQDWGGGMQQQSQVTWSPQPDNNSGGGIQWNQQPQQSQQNNFNLNGNQSNPQQWQLPPWERNGY